MICGYSKCLGALDFHHIDHSDKKFSISADGETLGWKQVVLELSKCVLVCANCHREIHAKLISLDLSFLHNTVLAITDIELNRIATTEALSDSRLSCECGKPKLRASARCRGCSNRATRRKKIAWPSYEEIVDSLKIMSMVKLGKHLGVSDKAIKKHMLRHDIITKNTMADRQVV